MDAVVLAGGIPRPDEPLYSHSNGEAKALIDVAGQPMIQWVLDALSEAESIERVVVVGLSAKAQLRCARPITYLSNQGKLLENLKAGTARVLELNPAARHILFVSSDIPGVTGEMVDWLVRTCAETDDDLYYNIIRRQDMDRRFPGSRRTWTRLKDMQVCGGDMNMVRAAVISQHSGFWERVIEQRKNPLAQARLFGLDISFKLLTRQLTADEVIRRVAQRLGLKGRAIVCPYPEIGMDVDKPNQLDLMRADLARRVRRLAVAEKPRRTTRSARKVPAARKTSAAKKAASKPAGRTARKAPARPKR